MLPRWRLILTFSEPSARVYLPRALRYPPEQPAGQGAEEDGSLLKTC